jgi:DNA-binding transcriptional regulator YhcF (GntR family)
MTSSTSSKRLLYVSITNSYQLRCCIIHLSIKVKHHNQLPSLNNFGHDLAFHFSGLEIAYFELVRVANIT